MYNKEYREYLNVLRTRDARPPFEQMARLVAAAPARNETAIRLFTKFANALVIGGIVAVGSWVVLARFNTSDIPVKIKASIASSLPSSQSSVPSFSSPYSHVPAIAPTNRVLHAGSKERQRAGSSEASLQAEFGVLPAAQINNSDNSDIRLQPCTIQGKVVSFQWVAADSRPALAIAIPPSDQEGTGNLFASIGGAIAQQFSSDASYRQFSFSDAFLGIGYTFSSSSSVRILAGEEVFNAPSGTTTNSIVFRDTTFVHNGQTFQNVLGEVHSVTQPTLTRTYWLGASYRYTLGDKATLLRPFAEAMAGGATAGLLTHQSLGAEFSASSNIDLDFLFQASELLAQNNVWLTKGGFSAAMEYRW